VAGTLGKQADMKKQTVTVARVYTLEGHDHLNKAIKILQQQCHIAGVTIIRGIAGIGDSGDIHTSSILSLSLELPLVIEFYDQPDKVEQAIFELKHQLNLEHIVTWPAEQHIR
jgi:PII-like signaling protein